MKSPIANLALSLVLLSTSATLSSAIPAPLPSPTGYASNSEEALAAEAARAQLRPVWRPGPRLDARSDASLAPTPLAAGLSPRGPIFSRRNQESKFNYRKRTSAGLAVAGNIAYGLNERDIAAPFGIGNGNVPLPVAMRVRRDASLVERDDDEEEEDWDCSEYDDNDGDDDDDWEGENEDEASSAPGPSSSQAAASSSSSGTFLFRLQCRCRTYAFSKLTYTVPS